MEASTKGISDMDKYAILFSAISIFLSASLIFILFQSLRLGGGVTSSSEAKMILPLIVQANVSLIAFWGFILVFRINSVASQRIELMKNLWEIGFKRDEIKVRTAETKEEKQERAVLMKLNEELGEDAKTRREAIEFLYQWENAMMTYGLLAIVFFVLSIASGVYGIGVAFNSEQVGPFTFFTPFVCLFTGIISTIFALLSSSVRLQKSLEVR
jgi:hypothetical protein